MRVADGFFCGFTDDWRAKVPGRLLDKLLENYRDYFDEAGNMIPGREENFEAFVYFVDRILTSVNSKVNDYGPKIRNSKPEGQANYRLEQGGYCTALGACGIGEGVQIG